MPWAKFDDGILDHPKVLMAGPLPFLMFMSSIIWSCSKLTDGWIPRRQVRRLIDFEDVAMADEDTGELIAVDPMALAARLVDCGLWHTERNGFRIHDFEEYQPDGAIILASRKELSAKRSTAGKKGAAKRWGMASDDKANSKTDMLPSESIAKPWQADSPEPETRRPTLTTGEDSLSLTAPTSTAVEIQRTPAEVKAAIESAGLSNPSAA